MSLISRNMANHMEERKEFHRTALAKLASFRVRNTWMFLFPEPVKHQRGARWNPPDHLILVA